MASPEAESLMELLRDYVHSEDLQEAVEKLQTLKITQSALLALKVRTLERRLDKWFPKDSAGVTTGILSAIQARKDNLRREGEPLLKKARRSAEDHLSSGDLFDAEKTYFEKLLEPPSELPLSADELMKFLSLIPVPLPTRDENILTAVRDPEVVVLDTSAPVDALASFSDVGFKLIDKAPRNEATSSHALCYLTADFLLCLNRLAPRNRRLQSLEHVLDAANPTSTNEASRPLKSLSRPDLQFYVKDCLILRWENKIDGTLMEQAVHENTSKLRAWSTLFYGQLPYVIGGSCARSKFRWLKIYQRDKEITSDYISRTYDLNERKSLAEFLHSVIRMHCLLQKLQEKLDGEIRVQLYAPKIRNNGNVIVTVYPDFVAKEIRGLKKAEFTRLKTLYQSIAGSRYLIQGIVPPRVKGTTTLQLQPVGDPVAEPRSLEDLEHAMHDMLHGLEELHRQNYTHRDLRWENCIKVMVAGDWKWVIIDLEEAGPHNELWVGRYLLFWDAETLEGDSDKKKLYTKGSDIYQLGKLIAAWLDDNSVGHEENLNPIRSRAEKMQQERAAAATLLEDVCKKGCKRCRKFDAKL